MKSQCLAPFSNPPFLRPAVTYQVTENREFSQRSDHVKEDDYNNWRDPEP